MRVGKKSSIGTHLVLDADTALALAPLGHAISRPVQHDVEVHSVDTRRRVVLDAQINVLRDSETKVAGVGEVLLQQLVLLDLQARLEQLECLLSADGDAARNLLVTTDRPLTDGVTRLSEDRLLPSQLLQDLGGLLQPVTRLTGADVLYGETIIEGWKRILSRFVIAREEKRLKLLISNFDRLMNHH